MHATGRFTTLDGLRGLAALFVLLHHCGQAAGSGYLGVDLFFLLSGFVLSQAYGEQLLSDMSVARFTALRLVRIYPLFAVGSLLAIVLQSGSPAMLLFPWPGSYPANPPFWSLAFEFGVNIAWAAVLPWASRWVRLAVLSITGLATLWGAMGWGATNYGLAGLAHPALFWLTTARVAFSYTLGCEFHALYRHRKMQRRTTALALLPLAVLPIVMLPNPGNVPLWDLAAVFLVIPAIVWLGIVWQAPLPGAMDMLGKLSFPLYCIHAPVVMLFLGRPALLGVAVALLIPLAMILGELDGPSQRLLRRWLRLDRPRATRLASA